MPDVFPADCEVKSEKDLGKDAYKLLEEIDFWARAILGKPNMNRTVGAPGQFINVGDESLGISGVVSYPVRFDVSCYGSEVLVNLDGRRGEDVSIIFSQEYYSVDIGGHRVWMKDSPIVGGLHKELFDHLRGVHIALSKIRGEQLGEGIKSQKEERKRKVEKVIIGVEGMPKIGERPLDGSSEEIKNLDDDDDISLAIDPVARRGAVDPDDFERQLGMSVSDMYEGIPPVGKKPEVSAPDASLPLPEATSFGEHTRSLDGLENLLEMSVSDLYEGITPPKHLESGGTIDEPAPIEMLEVWLSACINQRDAKGVRDWSNAIIEQIEQEKGAVAEIDDSGISLEEDEEHVPSLDELDALPLWLQRAGLERKGGVFPFGPTYAGNVSDDVAKATSVLLFGDKPASVEPHGGDAVDPNVVVAVGEAEEIAENSDAGFDSALIDGEGIESADTGISDVVLSDSPYRHCTDPPEVCLAPDPNAEAYHRVLASYKPQESDGSDAMVPGKEPGALEAKEIFVDMQAPAELRQEAGIEALVSSVPLK